MPLPALGVMIGGGVVAALVQFFTSKAGLILAGLGLSFIFMKGIQTIMGFMLADFNTLQNALASQSGNFEGQGLGAIMLQWAQFVGFFDGLNIIVSGYMAVASVKQLKVIVGRLQS